MKYGMAIDLSKCVGCGACALACKTENNTEHQQGGSKFNWADYLTFTSGTFPNVSFEVRPVLCNHCTNPDCIPVCPVAPDVNGHKAIYKTTDGITMYDVVRCTGCRLCQDACRYSSMDVIADDVQYSVLHYNPNTGPTHSFWADNTSVITNGTATPLETATAAGSTPPYKNDYTDLEVPAVRPQHVIEKCTFCRHRVTGGEQPYCVVSCPAGARVFGDLDDSGSAISLLIAGGYRRLANNTGAWLSSAGTDPNVYYVGEYGMPTVTEAIIAEKPKKLLIYPNPVRDNATAEFDLETSGTTTITIYNISGRDVRKIALNELKLSGNNKVEFNVNGLSAGTYICVLKSGKETQSANFIVTK